MSSLTIKKQLMSNAYFVKSKDDSLKISKEYEKLFLSQMFQIIFSKEESSNEEKAYHSMLVDQYGNNLKGNFGLADKILETLFKVKGDL